MINPLVRLLLPTGNTYPEGENAGAYDSGIDATTYEANLAKLKNSDSGIAGYKLFDIHTFYPGKIINFNVIVDRDPNLTPNELYGSIHLQLFDPLEVAQSVLDVASDIVNIETNNITGLFVGNLTRNAYYSDVISSSVEVKPDFSKHCGRFVAQNIDNSNAFDTCIIKSYTPNVNPLLGGTFTLTGDF